ncbi:hypothetical protein OIU85_028343 [Salix viminalis]|uniref:Uncharacterized protein n=1 Tax=Salix viminalis TaxID=40686 RepID=A0A9Q0QKA7_SALVM|nr:hypothetical protein OIU85_028343 [Salix viminalis]
MTHISSLLITFAPSLIQNRESLKFVDQPKSLSGGPFGVEDSVQAAGPLLALLGFLLFPLIWSIPEALITAEMGTMFPENGGYVVWVSSALGPLLGVSTRLDEMAKWCY